jgi:hypothetical protein
MRKKRPATRDLPLQCGPEAVRLDRDDQEVVVALEVARGGLPHGVGSREMDESIRDVDCGALEPS